MRFGRSRDLPVKVPPKTTPRLFLIDGYALIYRSFFAFVSRPLTNSRGENTSAAWGVATFLNMILEDFDPDYIAVIMDAGHSHRERLYPDYKATREKMPEELRESLPKVMELIEGMVGSPVAVDGWEADDVIGTLAARAREAGIEAVIVSGDKDFYQLVREGVHLLNPGRGGAAGVDAEWVDLSTAHERLGVPPEQVVDYLAMVGDTSDNVPGAPGVGPKTARSLLGEYGTLDALLEAAPGLKAKRPREALTEHRDQVTLSRDLVTIRTDAPIDLDLEGSRARAPDLSRIRPLLVDLEFRTLLEKWTADAEGSAAPESPATHHLLGSPDALAGVLERVRRAGHLYLATVSGTERAMGSALAGVALAVEPGETWYLPLGHRPSGELTLGLEPVDDDLNLPPLSSASQDGLRRVLADPDVAKRGHDLKEIMIALALEGAALDGLEFDTMVGSYVEDPGRRHHDLLALATDHLGRELRPWKEMVGTGQSEISFAEIAPEDAASWTGEHVDAVARLTAVLRKRLEDHGLGSLLEDLELPLIPVLADMERNGIRIDESFFRRTSSDLGRELGRLQAEIFSLAGREFNVNSTPQLREVLFEELGLPVIKKTKTGPSTDSSVLEELATQGHALPTLILEFRQLEKLRSTYVDALPRLVNRRTGRIHTSFNQAVAATGRLSSSDPNLQNIPIRTEQGRQIRKGFVADPGHLLLAVDYSQIELRVLAHFSGDEAFLHAFRERIDIHRQTAALIFEVEIDHVTPRMRAQAKTINFATIYGQGDVALARQLDIPREEARTFIDAYFERFAGVRAFLDGRVAFAKEHGYVETLMGRRRYVPELRARNWNTRSFGERVAQNTPIQGTAADLMKRAMIDVHAALETESPRSRMLLQVHDELLLEVPEEEVGSVRDLVVARMEGAVELAVPLVAEAGVGSTWYDAKG